MTEQEPRTTEQICAQMIARRAEGIASRLRDTADRIERHSRELGKVGAPGIPSYASVASSYQNEIRALLGNLQLDGLTTDAYDADAARVRRIAAETIAARIEARSDEVLAQVKDDPLGRAGGAVIAVGAAIAREYAAKEG